jgi:hypothetical protein
MLTKNTKKVLLGLTLLTSLSNLYAGDFGGGNGGDSCENRIKNISNDVEAWILKGGSSGLNFQDKNSMKSYNKEMLKAIKQTVISCTDKTLYIGDAEKTCINKTLDTGKRFIECNFNRFSGTTEDHQYRLIHHEYAGLAGIEVNNGMEESDYNLSNQVTGFLENVIVKKLTIKGPDGLESVGSDTSGLRSMFFIKLLQKISHIQNVGEDGSLLRNCHTLGKIQALKSEGQELYQQKVLKRTTAILVKDYYMRLSTACGATDSRWPNAVTFGDAEGVYTMARSFKKAIEKIQYSL